MSDKKTNPVTNSESTLEIDPNTGLHRIYDWKPYTIYRIRRILRCMDMQAETIWQGYKANRKPGYCALYRIVRISDGKVIHPGINLYSLQKFFARLDFPLEDEYSIHSTSSPRNKGAVAFLKAVQALSDYNETER